MDACWGGGAEMNIIELAKQVGFQTDNAGVWVDDSYIEDQLEALCKLAVAHEREECAKVCEEPGWNAANWCAKAIRARSNT
jgi:hypothetical protein